MLEDTWNPNQVQCPARYHLFGQVSPSYRVDVDAYVYKCAGLGVHGLVDAAAILLCLDPGCWLGHVILLLSIILTPATTQGMFFLGQKSRRTE